MPLPYTQAVEILHIPAVYFLGNYNLGMKQPANRSGKQYKNSNMKLISKNHVNVYNRNSDDFKLVLALCYTE